MWHQRPACTCRKSTPRVPRRPGCRIRRRSRRAHEFRDSITTRWKGCSISEDRRDSKWDPSSGSNGARRLLESDVLYFVDCFDARQGVGHRTIMAFPCARSKFTGSLARCTYRRLDERNQGGISDAPPIAKCLVEYVLNVRGFFVPPGRCHGRIEDDDVSS